MINKKYHLPVLLILTLIVLLTPLISRFSNDYPIIPGSGTYYDLRVSNDLANSSHYDFLQEREHSINLFHYIISPFSHLFNVDYFLVASIIFACLSILLFYDFLVRISSNNNLPFVSSLLLLFSPIFIYLFTSFKPEMFAFFLLIGFFRFVSRKNYFAVVFILLLSMTNFGFLLIALLFSFAFYLYDSDVKFLLIVSIPAFLASLIFGLFHNSFFLITMLKPSIVNYFTSFGAEIGLSFFYFFLALLGLFVIRESRPILRIVFLSMIIFFILSIYSPIFRIIFNLYLCYYAAQIVVLLFNRKWAIYIIKRFTLLLILCGIIFSSAMYSNQIVNSEPSKELFDSLMFLSTTNKTNVLSYDSLGFSIEYFSHKKALLDKSIFMDKNLTNQTNNIFYSRDFNILSDFINNYKIDYILVTKEMENGLIWSKPDEGLLFLLDNANEFNLIYDSKEVSIWSFELIPLNSSI